MMALQTELRAVEADILNKTHSSETIKATLTQRMAAHGTAAANIDQRLRSINREAELAARPYLRTADRLDVP